MTSRQQPTHRCEACGADVLVMPQDGGYEFDWRCTCGYAGTISWFHGKPAPIFQGARQPSLFQEAV